MGSSGGAVIGSVPLPGLMCRMLKMPCSVLSRSCPTAAVVAVLPAALLLRGSGAPLAAAVACLLAGCRASCWSWVWLWTWAWCSAGLAPLACTCCCGGLGPAVLGSPGLGSRCLFSSWLQSTGSGFGRGGLLGLGPLANTLAHCSSSSDSCSPMAGPKSLQCCPSCLTHPRCLYAYCTAAL